MDLYEYHMFIRKTTYADLDTVMAIYDQARTYMIDNGNPSQWAEGHPKRSLLEEDIKEGVSYVVLGEDGIIHGVFAFIIGEDPTYKVIENGGWLNEHIYGTIHRIAAKPGFPISGATPTMTIIPCSR